MNDLNFVLPQLAQVWFPILCRGIPQQGFYSQTIALSSLSEMGGATGFIGTEIFHNTCWARFKGGSQPTNLDELTRLSKRIAKDYYHFASARHDFILNGIVPWEPEGLTGVVEFTYDLEEVSTRVVRSMWANEPQELIHEVGTEVDTTTPFWVELHGIGPIYSWTWSDEWNGGSWDAEPGFHEGSTRDMSAPAIEINGIMGLDGAVVQLMPTDHCYYVFADCCGGQLGIGYYGSGYGSGVKPKCIPDSDGCQADKLPNTLYLTIVRIDPATLAANPACACWEGVVVTLHRVSPTIWCGEIRPCTASGDHVTNAAFELQLLICGSPDQPACFSPDGCARCVWRLYSGNPDADSCVIPPFAVDDTCDYFCNPLVINFAPVGFQAIFLGQGSNCAILNGGLAVVTQ